MGARIVRETYKCTHRVMVKNDSDKPESVMRYLVLRWAVAVLARANIAFARAMAAIPL